ncbi:MAG TPA: hypothetical protein VH701_01930 [Vicinamibacterales bacterium]|jgi:hypothetical protein
MTQLKPLSTAAIPGALAKVERYRLLGEPGEAESICLDILSVDPGNREALIGLILALTDQFAGELSRVNRATEVWSELTDEYERAYYGGLICERKAKALLRQSTIGSTRAAVLALKEALACYARAEPLRPPDNDEAILRWNACVRLLERYPVEIPDDDRETLMLE